MEELKKDFMYDCLMTNIKIAEEQLEKAKEELNNWLNEQKLKQK